MATTFGGLQRFRIAVRVARGRISAQPDPAEVDQGTIVEWVVSPEAGMPTVDFEVYFSGRTPFEWRRDKTRVIRGDSGLISAQATEPGDYKYGIRAVESDTSRILADDDPRLIVRRQR